MSKITEEELMAKYKAKTEPPPDSTATAVVHVTMELPRECPWCGAEFTVPSGVQVTNPAVRLEICPTCREKEQEEVRARQAAAAEEKGEYENGPEVTQEDLPELPVAEDYWQD